MGSGGMGSGGMGRRSVMIGGVARRLGCRLDGCLVEQGRLRDLGAVGNLEAEGHEGLPQTGWRDASMWVLRGIYRLVHVGARC